jgi:orotidine-5'-phosphate decarboxylase
MGADSVKPFLQYDGKWAIVLGLTSNPGASDFELQNMADGKPLYEHVLSTVASWGSDHNIMFVVGATRSDEFLHIRKIIPHHFLLVPGVGAQGGSLEEISKKAMNNEVGLLVNVSRDIIYCSKENDYDKRAGEKAKDYARQMSKFL